MPAASRLIQRALRPLAGAPPAVVAARDDPTLAWNRSFWATYEWPQHGDEWSAPFGGTEAMWHGIVWPRVRAFLPCWHALEIGPGHGRWTQYLRRKCDRLTVVDVCPECVAACRQRFGDEARLAAVVNDGRSLRMLADDSIDFAFAWEALVHSGRAVVREYLHELARTLRPGGHALIHHSNLGAYRADQVEGLDPWRDLRGRSPDLTAALFRDDCRGAGLRCVSQEIIPWGPTSLWLDCLSLVARDDAGMSRQTAVVERADWPQEVETVRRTARLYGRVTAA